MFSEPVFSTGETDVCGLEWSSMLILAVAPDTQPPGVILQLPVASSAGGGRDSCLAGLSALVLVDAPKMKPSLSSSEVGPSLDDVPISVFGWDSTANVKTSGLCLLLDSSSMDAISPGFSDDVSVLVFDVVTNTTRPGLLLLLDSDRVLTTSPGFSDGMSVLVLAAVTHMKPSEIL